MTNESKGFVENVRKIGKNKKVSPSTLQGHFLKYMDEPLKAIEKVNELFMNKFETSKI
jgi:hypothetical protein